MTFGIIGFGAFGNLLAQILCQYGKVLVCSKRDVSADLPRGVAQVDFEDVAKSQVVVITSGLDDLQSVCDKLSKQVGSETIVMDVCSVKTKAIEIMRSSLGGKCQLIGTHPLFGPQTIKNNQIYGEKIVLCPIDVKNLDNIKMLLSDILKLKIIEMGPEDHDKEMAWVHALTFFVGRGLLNMKPPKSSLATGYYQKLLDLVDMESKHSLKLFNEVEKYNPYASDMRKTFITKLSQLNEEIKG